MSFKEFLSTFLPKVQQKNKQVNLAAWILETTGGEDAATLKADLETELRLLFHDHKTFERLVAWDKDPSLTDPYMKREVNVLIRSFKPNLIPKDLLERITQEEANLALLASQFRAEIRGKRVSDNEIRESLKWEANVQARKEVWEGSKQIGRILAPHILKLVYLRNAAAKSLGYSNYFSMQLELQEVDEEELFETLDAVAAKSEEAYTQVIDEIHEQAAKRFGLPLEKIGPWAWADPFCQEDPLDVRELDEAAKELDILETSRQFFEAMGFDVETVLKRSDNFERPGKCQHAFCTHIDREGDVRTLNNVKPTIKWLETVLHELGHAVYELGYDTHLPWLLREPPHMITTEAMALLMGRQAYRAKSLAELSAKSTPATREKAEKSLRRRQLIFSRWALMMAYFERELYRQPEQDLNRLWWDLVKKFQKIHETGSTHGYDWAAKHHIGLAPVYYFSYLLGELLASSLEEHIAHLPAQERGGFLREKLFNPGNQWHWNTLVEHTTGQKLSPDAWLKQFAQSHPAFTGAAR